MDSAWIITCPKDLSHDEETGGEVHQNHMICHSDTLGYHVHQGTDHAASQKMTL